MSHPLLVVGAGTVGGVEEHVATLAAAFRSRGLAPLVVAPFEGEFTHALLETGQPARDIAIVEMSDRSDVAAIGALVWMCKARGVTVVHSHLRGADVIATPAAALAGIPAVCTLHGVDRSAHEVMLHRLYGLNFIAVSEAGRLSAVRAGISGARVEVVHNGVDVERFNLSRVDRRTNRRALGMDDASVLITMIARLTPEKDPMALLEVAGQLESSHPYARFALVGTGPLEAQLRRAATGRPNVAVLGTRRNIPAILSASDVLLLPSKSESLPLVVMEAMAMEVPVVSYSVGGVAEAVTPTSGVLVPPGNVATLVAEVARLVDNQWTRRAMGRAGRMRVLEEFTHTHTALQVLAHYETLEASFKANGHIAASSEPREGGVWAP